MTKGDNNAVEDTGIYPEGQQFVYREDIVGLVYGYIPHVGWMSLWLKETPFILCIVTVTLIVVGVAS